MRGNIEFFIKNNESNSIASKTISIKNYSVTVISISILLQYFN